MPHTSSAMTSSRSEMLRFIRYAATGVMNTLISLAVIFICKDILRINPWWANLIGYAAGLINAFVWQRLWVFGARSRGWLRQSLPFLAGFAVCYLLQLAVTWLLASRLLPAGLEVAIPGFTLSAYGVATICGMAFYTVANFLFNRLVTFRK